MCRAPKTDAALHAGRPKGDRPITGLVRSEIIVDKKEFSHSLADRNHIPYQPVDPDDPNWLLTVRERNDGPRRTVPRGAWKIVEGTHLAMDRRIPAGQDLRAGVHGQGSGPGGARDPPPFAT